MWETLSDSEIERICAIVFCVCMCVLARIAGNWKNRDPFGSRSKARLRVASSGSTNKKQGKKKTRGKNVCYTKRSGGNWRGVTKLYSFVGKTRDTMTVAHKLGQGCPRVKEPCSPSCSPFARLSLFLSLAEAVRPPREPVQANVSSINLINQKKNRNVFNCS